MVFTSWCPLNHWAAPPPPSPLHRHARDLPVDSTLDLRCFRGAQHGVDDGGIGSPWWARIQGNPATENGKRRAERGGRGGGARVTQLSLWNHQEPHPTAILQSEPVKLHQNFTRVCDWRLDIHCALPGAMCLRGCQGRWLGGGAACTGPPGGPPNRSSGGALDPNHPPR